MPTTDAIKEEKRHASRRSFWIHDDTYAKVCKYVSKHRNYPDDLTINQFVRDALEASLSQLAKGKK